MHPSYVPIDPKTLKRLYVDDRLTAEEIAGRLGCAPNTVLRRLRQFGIPARQRGPQPSNPDALSSPHVWSPEMAYVVGLIATDGNLSRQHWGLSLASNDTALLETVRQCLHLTNAITPYTDSRCYHIQWRDRHLYEWLTRIGLTPAKSLTLGPLIVPDEYFADFFRGCLDGDGSILVYTDRYHTTKKECYVYERLYVSLFSASPPFLNWVRARICMLLGVNGVINEDRRLGRSVWRLRYAKADSIRVLGWIPTRRSLPSSETRQGRTLSFPAGLQSSTASGEAKDRLAVQ